MPTPGAAPSGIELTPAAELHSQAKAAKDTRVIDLETIPATTNALSPASAAAPAEPAAAPEPKTAASAGLAVTPNPASPEPAAPPAASPDELPPLPANLGQPGAAAMAPEPRAAATQPTAAAPARSAPSADEELPPLPPDLGSTPSAAANVPAPRAAARANEPPARVAMSGAPHAEQEVPVPVPVPASDEHPALASPALDPKDRNADAGAAPVAPAPPPTAAAPAGEQSAVVPGLNKEDLPPLPADLDTSAPPPAAAPAAPASQPYPTRNPNLEPQPTAASIAELAPDASTLPPAIVNRSGSRGSDLMIPEVAAPASSLRPDLMREVERIARNQEDEARRQAQNPQQPPASQPRDSASSDLRTQTQLDISRAPSPAEARPIKAIPVPEDWVPLPPRNWGPQRKYWAAAATCHLPLYFQDPVLEHYGHSVENFVGPIGQFLTYPVDDPTQSTQRNQMVQPFFSAGLMGLQIIMWPYNLVMDPPWEAQYDLGYYRPGDNIPTDLYWLPLHGYGPPLHGSNY